MLEILGSIGIIVFIVYAIFNIIYLIELRRTGVAVRQLVKRTEDDLLPAVAAFRNILEDIQKTTYNVAMLTDTVRETAETAIRVERRISDLYERYKDGLGEAARANIAGLKAGVKAGVTTLIKDLSDKKEGSP